MEAKLIEQSIKEHFERNGTLDEMRSGLHVQVLKLLREQVNLKRDEPLCGGDMEQRGLLCLLNQLIIDYFHWYGYKHTLETFGLETGKKTTRKSRERLQSELNINFKNKELPLLLQILTTHTNKELPNKNMKQKVHHSTIAPRPIQSNGLKKIQEPTSIPKAIKSSETWGKAEILRGHSPSRKDIKKPQQKLNIRQRMLDENKPKEMPRKPKQAKPTDPSECQRRNIQIYDSDLSPISDTTSDEAALDDSDAYADIPNRYYYREQEPHETTYPNDHGEEGPYEGNQLLKLKNASNVQPVNTKRWTVEVESKGKEMTHLKSLHSLKSLNTKTKLSDRNPPKRSKFLTQRHADRSGEEPDIPVFKPKCPETVISTMELNSDEDTEEDSDDYL